MAFSKILMKIVNLFSPQMCLNTHKEHFANCFSRFIEFLRHTSSFLNHGLRSLGEELWISSTTEEFSDLLCFLSPLQLKSKPFSYLYLNTHTNSYRIFLPGIATIQPFREFSCDNNRLENFEPLPIFAPLFFSL